jgi:hypothetical protein
LVALSRAPAAATLGNPHSRSPGRTVRCRFITGPLPGPAPLDAKRGFEPARLKVGMATAGRNAGGRAEAGTSREPDCDIRPAGAAPRPTLTTPHERAPSPGGVDEDYPSGLANGDRFLSRSPMIPSRASPFQGEEGMCRTVLPRMEPSQDATHMGRSARRSPPGPPLCKGRRECVEPLCRAWSLRKTRRIWAAVPSDPLPGLPFARGGGSLLCGHAPHNASASGTQQVSTNTGHRLFLPRKGGG